MYSDSQILAISVCVLMMWVIWQLWPVKLSCNNTTWHFLNYCNACNKHLANCVKCQWAESDSSMTWRFGIGGKISWLLDFYCTVSVSFVLHELFRIYKYTDWSNLHHIITTDYSLVYLYNHHCKYKQMQSTVSKHQSPQSYHHKIQN